MVHHRIYPLFNFDLDLKVTQNIANYPLHHVTYAPVKFELLCPTNKEEKNLQENTLLTFDLGVKVT